jgi:hypothetical protein
MSSAAEFYENRKEHWEDYIKDHAGKAIRSFHDETGVPVGDVRLFVCAGWGRGNVVNLYVNRVVIVAGHWPQEED